MNALEVQNLVEANARQEYAEVEAIVKDLANLRGVVGHKDLAGNVIMSSEEFEARVVDVVEKLKAYGYDVFKDV